MFKKVFAEYGITLYSTSSNLKASIAERAIKTVKVMMFREFSIRDSYNWIDILNNIIRQYNNLYHQTIKMAPAKVHPEDKQHLRAIHNANYALKICGKVKFKVGDFKK